MTRIRRDEKDTEFGNWIRNHPLLDSRTYGFDNEDIDYVWFAFREGWLMTLEEKEYGAESSWAQRDTHNIIEQMLYYASGKKYRTARGMRKIEYKGHYIIQFEKTNPEDSEWIKINGEEVSRDELLRFLKTSKLPDF